MVQAMVNISDEANQILNIVKAKYNLQDKSKAIDKIVIDYGSTLLAESLRPEFIQRMQQVSTEKTIKIGSVDNLKKRH